MAQRHPTTYRSAMAVSALLDEGTWALARSRQGRDHATRLGHVARELVLTFRSHRFSPIYGASGLDGTPQMSGDDVRLRLCALTSYDSVKTYAGSSRGAACDACYKQIAVGEIEYDAVSEALEMRLDAACYGLLVEELARTRPTQWP